MRGWVDLAINGTFWIGAAAGALASVVLLDPRVFHLDTGWRFGFGIGGVLGLVILFFRRDIPESPRWLITHGYLDEAERVVSHIEETIEIHPNGEKLPHVSGTITLTPRGPIGFAQIFRTMLHTYPTRTVLGLALVMSQAFLYNGVSFTFALVLTRFYGVAEDRAGLYLLPFAAGNFLGPLLLGRLFDSWGRKPMIAGTYTISAALLVLSGYLFLRGDLTTTSQTLLWGVIFIFASAEASSAYLTVSEIFPVEMRGMTIALFFSTGTALGGTFAPWLFGKLIDTGVRSRLYYGYLFAAAVLMVTVLVVLLFGVKSERTSLEQVAEPLSLAGEGEVPEAGPPGVPA